MDILEYFRQNFGAGGGANSWTNAAPINGITAIGGVISEHTDGGFVYRSHTFIIGNFSNRPR